MRARSALIFLFGALALVAHCQEEEGDEPPPEDGEEGEMPPEDGEGEMGEEGERLGPDRLRAIHDAMDANKDGKVSKVEMHEFTKKIRLESSKRDVANIIEEMDKDKDGKVSETEYFNDMESASEDAAEQSEEDKAETKRYMEFEKVKFKAADKNKDGFLNAEELPIMQNPELYDDVLTLVAEHEFKNKDKDGNGQLKPEEFWMHSDDASEEEKNDPEMLSEFKTLDKDNSGNLNFEEYKKYESGVHHTEVAVAKILEVADKDKDSHVNADEFTGSDELHDHNEVSSHFWEWDEGLKGHAGEL